MRSTIARSTSLECKTMRTWQHTHRLNSQLLQNERFRRMCNILQKVAIANRRWVNRSHHDLHFQFVRAKGPHNMAPLLFLLPRIVRNDDRAACLSCRNIRQIVRQQGVALAKHKAGAQPLLHWYRCPEVLLHLDL